MTCPCGSKQTFENCCGPYLAGEKLPATAEVLMRSRYVAYTKSDIGYLGQTHAHETRRNFDPVSTRHWAETSKFTNLQILRVKNGGLEDQNGTVEFIATFTQNGQTLAHHEISHFARDARGPWCFVEGHSHRHGPGHDQGASHGHGAGHHPAFAPAPRGHTFARDTPKPGRNDPCPCGSGKKWKTCCGG